MGNDRRAKIIVGLWNFNCRHQSVNWRPNFSFVWVIISTLVHIIFGRQYIFPTKNQLIYELFCISEVNSWLDRHFIYGFSCFDYFRMWHRNWCARSGKKVFVSCLEFRFFFGSFVLKEKCVARENKRRKVFCWFIVDLWSNWYDVILLFASKKHSLHMCTCRIKFRYQFLQIGWF